MAYKIKKYMYLLLLILLLLSEVLFSIDVKKTFFTFFILVTFFYVF